MQRVTIIGELESWRVLVRTLVYQMVWVFKVTGIVGGKSHNDLKVGVMSKEYPSLRYVIWGRRNKLHKWNSFNARRQKWHSEKRLTYGRVCRLEARWPIAQREWWRKEAHSGQWARWHMCDWCGDENIPVGFQLQTPQTQSSGLTGLTKGCQSVRHFAIRSNHLLEKLGTNQRPPQATMRCVWCAAQMADAGAAGKSSSPYTVGLQLQCETYSNSIPWNLVAVQILRLCFGPVNHSFWGEATRLCLTNPQENSDTHTGLRTTATEP